MKQMILLAALVIGMMTSCSKNRETKYSLDIQTSGQIVEVSINTKEIAPPYDFVASGEFTVYVESTGEISDIVLQKKGKGKALGTMSLSGVSGTNNYYRMLNYYP